MAAITFHVLFPYKSVERTMMQDNSMRAIVCLSCSSAVPPLTKATLTGYGPSPSIGYLYLSGISFRDNQHPRLIILILMKSSRISIVSFSKKNLPFPGLMNTR